MDVREEVVLTLTDEIDNEEATFGMGPFNVSTRRLVMFGHMGFRGLALLTFLFGSWFLDSFITAFLFILINLSVDFWFVKNVSGRILVGMRWSSQTSEDGKTEWLFDSRPPPNNETAGQFASGATITMTRREKLAQAHQSRASYVFWTSLIATPILWAVFVLTSLFSLHPWWAMVAAIGVVMSGANLYAYVRCHMSSVSDGASGWLSILLSKATPQVAVNLLSNLNQSVRKMASSSSSPAGMPEPTLRI